MKKLTKILFAALMTSMLLLGMTACGGSSGEQASGTVNPFAQLGVSTPSPQDSQTSSPLPTPTPTPGPVDNSSAIAGTWSMNIDYSGMDETTAAQYHASFDPVSMTLTFTDGGVMTTHAVNNSTGATNDTTGSWAFSGSTLSLTMSDGTKSTFTYQNGTLRCTDAGSEMVYLTKGGALPTPQTSSVTPTPTPTPTPTGSDVSGTWNMQLDLSSLDSTTAEQYRQMFAGVTMTMTLNADGSYQTSTVNASTGMNQSTTGTWSMAGDTVTMTDSTTGASESFTYANGRLIGVESYIMYFTR